MAKGPELKVILLGSYGVGKSSIIRQYVRGYFGASLLMAGHSVTIQPCYFIKDIVVDGCSVRICLWDLPGGDRQSVGSIFFRQAQAVLAVFDIADPKTLTPGLDYFMNEAQKHCPEASVFLVGNKLDKRATSCSNSLSTSSSSSSSSKQSRSQGSKRAQKSAQPSSVSILPSSISPSEVSREVAVAHATRVNATYAEVSASTAEGVNDLFVSVARAALKKRESALAHVTEFLEPKEVLPLQAMRYPLCTVRTAKWLIACFLCACLLSWIVLGPPRYGDDDE